MINKIFFNKAVYSVNELVELYLKSNVDNNLVVINIYNLDKKISELKSNLKIGINKISLGPFYIDFIGLIVEIISDSKIYYTCFSIDTNEEIYRYGFLSDFDKQDDNNDVYWMRDNHINYVQYYDWSYHHDDMISKKDRYMDSMKKINDLRIIKGKIELCKSLSMKNMAYGPIYAATKEYYLKHKDQAYYATKNIPLSFINTFYFMNISNNSSWRYHIINEYKKSIKMVGFDGIHLDTYGYPKKALDYYNNIQELDKEIPVFLKEVQNSLDKAKLIFNNVGAWPLTKEVAINQSAVYIEVWPPFETFYHLREIINKAKSFNKALIISAYISSFRLDRENAIYSALFTFFYINSLGATHLFLGENGAVLTQGYYSDYTKLSENEKKIIKRYQDFFVSYQSIIYDKSLKDVTMTHCGWDNEEYIVEGNYSLCAKTNHISITIRENKDKHLICLLNLENNNNIWNSGKYEPNLTSFLKMKIQINKNVKKVYFLNPENPSYIPILLDFNIYEGIRSRIIEFIIPKFKVGALIYFIEE